MGPPSPGAGLFFYMSFTPHHSLFALSGVDIQPWPLIVLPMNPLPVMSHKARLAVITEARRLQFARYLGYRALGYCPAMAYILSIRPL